MTQQHKRFYIFYFLRFHYWCHILLKITYLMVNMILHLISYKLKQKTNIVSEKDFAQLDCLLHQKPNATTLCLEGMILFANNKTSRWLDSKSQEERQDLLKKARIVAPEFKKLYRMRRQKERSNQTVAT